MTTPTQTDARDLATLEAGVAEIRRSPSDDGRLDLIVRRPAVDAREVVSEATLDTTVGLVGDTWPERPSTSSPDGRAHPGRQITLMNVRASRLVAIDEDRIPLAGDQLFVDLDLSYDNIPPGSVLEIGSARVEVTEFPHRGCKKFAARFGLDALRFVNSEIGKELNLRGVNARVVTSGTIRRGDAIRKVLP